MTSRLRPRGAGRWPKSATPSVAALRRHLRAQERGSRRDAAVHARRALAFIRRGRFFLAVGELIEAEVAKAEADVHRQIQIKSR